MIHFGRVWLRCGKLLAGLTAVALAVAVRGPATDAQHGDIHAHCVGDKAVVTQRPPGLEYITVICRDGLPEFVVAEDTGAVPAYDPVAGSVPRATPPDFGGWVTVWLNGRPLQTPYDPIRGVMEPMPYLAASTGRVMMPVRFFTEAFGGTVGWSQEEQRASLKLPGRTKTIQLWLEQDQALVGALPVDIDQPPVLFLDRMFVPVRFLMEGFGGEVQWDHMNRSARLEMPGLQCNNPIYCGELR